MVYPLRILSGGSFVCTADRVVVENPEYDVDKSAGDVSRFLTGTLVPKTR